jgi:nucleoside-diphosphate-sugar epimerase
MRRALLIGGSGFIGAQLAAELLRRGVAVDVLDAGLVYVDGGEAAERARAWRREVLLRGATLRSGGTDDTAALCDEIARSAPDVVVHLANLPLAGVAVAAPDVARASIVDGTANVVAAVGAEAPAARLVFVSSSMVYGDFTADPQPESGPLRPREPYGACKLEAEGLVRASGLDWTIVRPSAVYGPGDANGRFLQRLVEAAVRGEALPITGSLETRLDFTAVEDLVGGIATAAGAVAARGEAFNLTAGRSHSLREAIDIVRGLGYRVELDEQPPETFRPRRGTLDISRARRLLGYAPRRSLREGLGAYLRAVTEIG